MVRERVANLDRIAADPTLMVGKPVVRGTRIPVELVLEELAHNPDVGELLAAHPALTREDVQACLAYAVAMLNGEAILPAGRTKPQPANV